MNVPSRPYVIGNVNPGEIRWECAVMLAEARRLNVPIIGKISGPYLDVHRNDVLMAYWTDPDLLSHPWIIFIDSDIQASVADLDCLINVPDDVKVVSGIYANNFKTLGFRDVIFRHVPLAPDDPEYSTRLWRMEPYEHKTLLDLPGHPDAPHLKAVDGFGAGALAIHRSVVAEMFAAWGAPMPWFYCTIIAENQDDKPQWIGEDFGFGFRAKALGYTLWANTLVTVPHFKLIKITCDIEEL